MTLQRYKILPDITESLIFQHDKATSQLLDNAMLQE